MKWIKVIAINAGILCLCLGMIEAVLHFMPIKYKILPPLEPRGYAVYDPEMGYDIKTNFPTTTSSFYDLSYEVSSNELGCFDYPYLGEGPYIYLTGDSFAWGWTPLYEKWGKVIEKETGIRTLTCGVNGFGTKQELLKAKKILSSLKNTPKVIVVGYLGANDVDDDALFPNYTVENGYRVRSDNLSRKTGAALAFKQWLSADVILYNLVKNKVYPSVRTMFRPETTQSAPVSLEAVVEGDAYKSHIQNVLGFKKLAQDTGAKLLFVLIPSKNELIEGKTSWNDALKSHLDQHSIAYIDLFADVSAAYQAGEKLYWEYDGHWNQNGNKLAGELVTKALRSKEMIRSY